MSEHDANPPQPRPDSDGGQGGVFANPNHAQSDAKLVERAVRERWPIPDGVREMLARRAAVFAAHAKDARDIKRMGDLLVSIDRLNIAQEALDRGIVPPEAAGLVGMVQQMDAVTAPGAAAPAVHHNGNGNGNGHKPKNGNGKANGNGNGQH